MGGLATHYRNDIDNGQVLNVINHSKPHGSLRDDFIVGDNLSLRHSKESFEQSVFLEPGLRLAFMVSE
jgi:hypothetical protein